MKRLVFIVATLVAVIGHANAGTVEFFDSTFGPAEWTDQKVGDSSAGANYTVSTPSGGGTGGPTDPYRAVTHSWPAGGRIRVAHLFTLGQIEPSAQGGVASLDFLYHLMNHDEGIGDDVVGYYPLLRQGGIFYWTAGTEIWDTGVWTDFSRTGLSASSFSVLGGSPGSPDFSAAGSTIGFGYLSTNSSVGQFPPLESGIDDFLVTVYFIPEPSALVLLSMGVVALVAYASRRRRCV